MTNDRIFCLWVATAALAVIFAICALQAGCASRLSLPAVEYAEDAYGVTWACQDSENERHVWRVEDEL